METASARPAEHDAIEVSSLSKVFASQDGRVQALADVSFAIADAEFVSLRRGAPVEQQDASAHFGDCRG